MEKHIHEIHEHFKNKIKNKVLWSLAAISITFFYFFLPDVVIDIAIGKFSKAYSTIIKLIGASASTCISVAMIGWILFSTDSAFKGNNSTSKWIRSKFGSKIAEEKYRCSETQARVLWFKFFDTWGFQSSPHHNMMFFSYSASYSARLIYYLIRICIIFGTLGILAVLINHFLFNLYATQVGTQLLYIHLIWIVVYWGLFLVLFVSNRIGNGQRSTGCWWRLEDIYGRSEEIFRHDIINEASTYDEALSRVEQIRQALLNTERKSGASTTI